MKEDAELPRSVKTLEQRLKSATDSPQGWTQRRRVMAAVILGQLLPPAAIKGGTVSLALWWRREANQIRQMSQPNTS